MLKRDSTSGGKSKTREHVQTHARNFAAKVWKVAGGETLLLCTLEYFVSGLPKINVGKFYLELQEWSEKTQFPELLSDMASKLWKDVCFPEQQTSIQQQPSPRSNSSPRGSNPASMSPVQGETDEAMSRPSRRYLWKSKRDSKYEANTLKSQSSFLRRTPH